MSFEIRRKLVSKFALHIQFAFVQLKVLSIIFRKLVDEPEVWMESRLIDWRFLFQNEDYHNNYIDNDYE